MRKVKSYRDLRVWQEGRILVKEVYRAVKAFPKEEIYGLTSQIKRSAVSIPSNIAEGSSRRSTQEFLRFINIATGSLAELETQLILANDLEFMDSDMLEKLLQRTDNISRMSQGLYDALLAKTTRLATRDSNHGE
ncbi:MAG: four helix bundle protein [Pseudomonadota bacterium]|nr:four helix bundle protein [Pseudomonadota bacterium]